MHAGRKHAFGLVQIMFHHTQAKCDRADGAPGIEVARDLSQERTKRSRNTISKQRDCTGSENKKRRSWRDRKRLAYGLLCLGIFMNGEIVYKQLPQHQETSRITVTRLFGIVQGFLPFSLAAGN